MPSERKRGKNGPFSRRARPRLRKREDKDRKNSVICLFTEGKKERPRSVLFKPFEVSERSFLLCFGGISTVFLSMKSNLAGIFCLFSTFSSSVTLFSYPLKMTFLQTMPVVWERQSSVFSVFLSFLDLFLRVFRLF